MRYHEAARFLFALRRYPPAEGVESTKRLLAHLDHPAADLNVIQIAGSNGKGSTARMTESVLRAAGYDVGLYTSPHLNDLRERIQIDGRRISERAVIEFTEQVQSYVNDGPATRDPPTFFETITALAIWSFARADVDVAVLEVGIGGRYDATSAVTPTAAGVTSVSLEHTEMLGDTVTEIARDLATVAPPDAALVTAATDSSLAAIESVTDTYRVGHDADADLRVTDNGRTGLEQRIKLETDAWSVETALPVIGEHQARNAGVAAALSTQFDDVSPTAIDQGLRRAEWPGRFEVIERDPLVVLDGAHNPGSCEALARTLSTFEFDSCHLVFGAMADKDHEAMAAALPTADAVYTCRPPLERAETAAVLAGAFDGAGSVEPCGSVDDAIDAALSAADETDVVLICGSLRVVAAARHRWSRHHVTKRVETMQAADAVLESAGVSRADIHRLRADATHRVITTTLRPAQARQVRREMITVGGSGAISALVEDERDPVDVVLMGTTGQFNALVDALSGEPNGLKAVGSELKETLALTADTNETEAAAGTHAHAEPYPWETGTAVMGVLNVTPDSFHDGGQFQAHEDAIERAKSMIDAGADIIDVGGESTRPGADPVPVEEEQNRVCAVVEALSSLDALVSIDTRKPPVARAALAAGADILNDVSGLEDPQMRAIAAEHDVPVVVMHSIRTPVDPDVNVEYDDVVADTLAALSRRVRLAEKAGLDRSQIIVDPGVGFGKSAAESFALLGRLDEFGALGCPVLVGHSRKSMFSLVGHEDSDDRLPATLAATSLATQKGADIVRVHDVEENVAAVRTVEQAADSAW